MMNDVWNILGVLSGWKMGSGNITLIFDKYDEKCVQSKIDLNTRQNVTRDDINVNLLKEKWMRILMSVHFKG